MWRANLSLDSCRIIVDACRIIGNTLFVPANTTPAAAVSPFRCIIVRECEDRPGTDSWHLDPDGLSYAALGDAIDQAEALYGLNPGASIIINDGLGRTVSH